MTWRDAGWIWGLAAVLAGQAGQAQTLDNRGLNGKYFFRQMRITSDGSGSVTGGRSLLGTLTFDSSGHYSFAGQQGSGAGNFSAATGSGSYAVDPAGIVTLTDPLDKTQTLSARFSPMGLTGAMTETASNIFELLVAIPAPAGAASNASLNGLYRTAAIEFPGGSGAGLRNSIFSLQADGLGHFGGGALSGHAADQGGGSLLAQTISGASYAISADGTGTASFSSSASLLTGNRTIYISRDGNVLLGGSPGEVDFLIGVKAAGGSSNASWQGFYWGAGLRVETGSASSFAGSAFANAQGKLTWSRRLHGVGLNGAIDLTGVYGYQLSADGSGTAELAQVALGAGGDAFLGAGVSAIDPSAFELYIGMRMPRVSGSGVFVNPQGVTNAASSAPAGNPIAPGEYIAIYGSGLAGGSQTAKPPYPLSLGQVSVTVNNRPAPLYYVSAGQINALVPYQTDGTQAKIVVTYNGAQSNSVTVPLAASAPGVFSQDGSGTGAGSILHSDYSLVSADHPAHPGETVLVFLTGMGAVNPTVADGTAGGSNPLSLAVAPVAVEVGGSPADVKFSGLAPGFPGLYQLNVTIPQEIFVTGAVPLSIQTPSSYHDQVDVPISAQ